ncbi:hypothetical protein CMEL01_09366 [Colletotrichum melonis]|uniref:Uncharacterized protein n=1 Tax=Colletotrichum melonis TaxID=1209925 RepID=A0AAI9TWZ8_9PEZI|nr:hypothetical protein CMEL01_09366 [Colletotrichum melonis]
MYVHMVVSLLRTSCHEYRWQEPHSEELHAHGIASLRDLYFQ